MKKIAIVNSENRDLFCKYWMAYCEKNGIQYKTVDPYKSDIIRETDDCEAMMWNFTHFDHRDMLCARSILYSLETKGVKCFPSYRTCWHFDDKIAQKYLLEAVGAPLVRSYVFYDREEAKAWARETTYPKVFKLRGGAGSMNVKLAHNRREAEKLIEQSFGEGFRQYRWREQFTEAWNKYKIGKTTLRETLRPLKLALKRYPTPFDHYRQREMGYAYFQDFIPGNKYDIRVVVIGERAFAFKRMVRPGDFRASGSGSIVYDKSGIDERCVRMAFEVNEKLKSQCITFDFVFDEENKPFIVEISYAFVSWLYLDCEGYWTRDMAWHEGTNFDFCGWMVEQVLQPQ